MAYASALLYPFLALSSIPWPWSSLTVTSPLSFPPMGPISLSRSITSVFIQLLSRMPRSWASLIISSSTRCLPRMTMVLSRSSFYRIGTNNSFCCCYFDFYASISNLSFAWLMMIISRLSLLSTTSCLQTSLKLLAFPWNMTVVTYTLSDLLHCWNISVIGKRQINL